jgi:ribonuclease Z
MSEMRDILAKLAATNDPGRNPIRMPAIREKELTIITLGTGAPVPDIARAGPSNAIIYKKTCILVDCGRWASRRIIEAGIPFNQINGLIFTHLHQDHINAWPTVWMDSLFTRRTNSWKIWGPEGTAEIINAIKIFNRCDIKDRQAANINIEGLETEVHELKSEYSWEIGEIRVTAVLITHVPTMPCFSFRFDTPNKSILLSSDTTKDANLIKLGKKRSVDVLVHEILLDDIIRFAVKNKFLLGDESTADFIINGHTTIPQLIEIAKEINPKKLVLTHIMPTIASTEYIEKAIKEKFKGEVVCANDLDKF